MTGAGALAGAEAGAEAGAQPWTIDHGQNDQNQTKSLDHSIRNVILFI